MILPPTLSPTSLSLNLTQFKSYKFYFECLTITFFKLYLRSKTEKPPLISKPVSKYGKLAPKGLKSKLLNRLQGNSRQYFDSGDYNGNGSARRPSAPKLVPGKNSNFIMWIMA